MAASGRIAGFPFAPVLRYGGAKPNEQGAAQDIMAAAGDAVATGETVRTFGTRPAAPDEKEVILWEGNSGKRAWRMVGFAAFAAFLGLLSWLALELLLPHFRGSVFAGRPTASSLPLIILMLLGMLIIMVLPVWLRMSAKGRAHYMLTNRRALIWLGRNIVGEAVLFGSEVRIGSGSVSFDAPGLYLHWRMQDEGPNLVTFGDVDAPEKVASLAEKHGATIVHR